MALGDSENDAQMLADADYPVLIRSEKHGFPNIKTKASIYRTTRTGPSGWHEAVGESFHNNLFEGRADGRFLPNRNCDHASQSHTASTDALESELLAFSKNKRLGLILPCLYSELETEAMPNIVRELSHVPYLSQLVIGLDQATKKSIEGSYCV